MSTSAVNGQNKKKKKKTIEKLRVKILKWSEAFVHSSYTDFLF